MNLDIPPHTYIRTLTIQDADQVMEVELTGEGGEMRKTTKEQVEYTLTVCPELCAGIFKRTFAKPSSAASALKEAQALAAAGNENELYPYYCVKSTPYAEPEQLLACLLATKAVVEPATASTLTTTKTTTGSSKTTTSTSVATHATGLKPPLLSPAIRAAHSDAGRTLSIHTLTAAHPSTTSTTSTTAQDTTDALISLLLKDYLQRITTVHAADHVVVDVSARREGGYAGLGFVKVEVPPSGLETSEEEPKDAKGNRIRMMRVISESDEDDEL